MTDPKYFINISYVPSQVNGSQLQFLSGATVSLPTYSVDYFRASMPEVNITATGSSYTEALDNLLLIATSSTVDNGQNPLSNKRYY